MMMRTPQHMCAGHVHIGMDKTALLCMHTISMGWMPKTCSPKGFGAVLPVNGSLLRCKLHDNTT